MTLIQERNIKEKKVFSPGGLTPVVHACTVVQKKKKKKREKKRKIRFIYFIVYKKIMHIVLGFASYKQRLSSSLT
jgi:hypothetical protein